ncbi:hypothetical protein NEOLEDRAFT_1180741 [Neolentinus lepideus HHB14362 ss-1]|uniref:UbiA prenyltransferase n=1 Tax=Neolentinus lepideus HHB14362 ss-1 TaxID=1314782 RepID=A0A165QNI9_9AGAM|nr:hypothetical protein NEOLEDRAFT_1180741 [Neolentinus lepideus HHB14362 ss-1]
MSIDEDKPDRPIPSGKITMDSAKARWAVVLWGFMMMGVSYSHVLAETLCAVLTVAFLNMTSSGNHWFGKNCVAMTAGMWAVLSASWKIITPLPTTDRSYILTIAVWCGTLMQIQDIRDVEGDAKVGRRTLPLVFGDGVSRKMIAFGLIPAAFWILYTGGLAVVAPTSLAVAHLYLGYRILQSHGPCYDHKTCMVSNAH